MRHPAIIHSVFPSSQLMLLEGSGPMAELERSCARNGLVGRVHDFGEVL